MIGDHGANEGAARLTGAQAAPRIARPLQQEDPPRLQGYKLGVRRTQARGCSAFEQARSGEGSPPHRALAATATGAPGRTIICERSGPMDTYDTGTPT